MSNDKLFYISNGYMPHCGVNYWKELMVRRGMVDYRYLTSNTSWNQFLFITYIITPDYAARWTKKGLKILANIGQQEYFQISGVNGVFSGLWVGKPILWATPIHLTARNHGKAIENGFQACGTTFWRWLPNNSE